MPSLLTLISQVLAYDDLSPNSNPSRRMVDWRRSKTAIPVENPMSQRMELAPQQSLTVFNSARSLDADDTTEYSLELSTLSPSRYRLAWTGTGAAPDFRTPRTMELGSGTLTIALNSNQTVTLTHTAGSVFTAIGVGDVVFFPGVTTGDTAVFNPLNEGVWSVLAASATTLILARPAGTVFSGASEATTVPADTSVLAFSASGAQVGDTLDLVLDGRAAVLLSNDFVDWDTLTGSQTITVAVDQTAPVTHSIVDQDFIDAGTSYTTVGNNSLEAWAAVFNYLIAGVTTTVKGTKLAMTSDKGKDVLALVGISAGSLVDSNMFEVGTATGSVSGGFASSALRSYSVVAVTAEWVEFISTLPLAEQVVVPGDGGVALYVDAKRYLLIESDQEVALQLNGSETHDCRLEPWVAGDPDSVGRFEKSGTTYSLTIVNRSTARANLMVVSAE